MSAVLTSQLFVEIVEVIISFSKKKQKKLKTLFQLEDETYRLH